MQNIFRKIVAVSLFLFLISPNLTAALTAPQATLVLGGGILLYTQASRICESNVMKVVEKKLNSIENFASNAMGDLVNKGLSRIPGVGRLFGGSNSATPGSSADNGPIGATMEDGSFTSGATDTVGAESGELFGPSLPNGNFISGAGGSLSLGNEVPIKIESGQYEGVKKELQKVQEELQKTQLEVSSTRAQVKEGTKTNARLTCEQRFKEMLLSGVKKYFLDRMVNQTVAWIQGDSGRPKFVDKPLDFMKEATDDALGSLVQDTALVGKFCSPVHAERLKLFLGVPKVDTNSFESKVSCSWSDVTKNINDFRKDFGGGRGAWDNFRNILNPENNRFGLEIIIEDELINRTAEQTDAARTEVIAGKGFLGSKMCQRWEKIPEIPGICSGEVSVNFDLGVCGERKDRLVLEPGQAKWSEAFYDLNAKIEVTPTSGTASSTLVKLTSLGWRCVKPETVTPGSVIADVTTKAINKDFDFIINDSDLTSYIAAIGNAITNRLTKTANKGLKYLFRNDRGDFAGQDDGTAKGATTTEAYLNDPRYPTEYIDIKETADRLSAEETARQMEDEAVAQKKKALKELVRQSGLFIASANRGFIEEKFAETNTAITTKLRSVYDGRSGCLIENRNGIISILRSLYGDFNSLIIFDGGSISMPTSSSTRAAITIEGIYAKIRSEIDKTLNNAGKITDISQRILALKAEVDALALKSDDDLIKIQDGVYLGKFINPVTSQLTPFSKIEDLHGSSEKLLDDMATLNNLQENLDLADAYLQNCTNYNLPMDVEDSKKDVCKRALLLIPKSTADSFSKLVNINIREKCPITPE